MLSFALYVEVVELLKPLLEPQAGGTVGKERRKNLSQDVAVFIDPHGSYRFVKFVNGEPAAAVQIVTRDKKHGIVARAYTRPEFRRKGFATELLQYGRKMFGSLEFSSDQSEMGKAWVGSVEI